MDLDLPVAMRREKYGGSQTRENNAEAARDEQEKGSSSKAGRTRQFGRPSDGVFVTGEYYGPATR